MTDVLTREEVETAGAADQVTVAPARIGRFDYKWVALGVVLIGTIMTILDSTIVNIAIPTLQSDLHAGSYSDIAWVITGYLLAQGAVIPMTGWATDRFGTKRLYLITIALFTIASAACGLAQNLGELIFFRVLQGIGGGMLMPIGMTIILQAVGPQNMGRMMGIFGIPMLLAPAVGPVLGGWFVQDFTWRLIFYVNVPIGIVGMIAASRYLVESHKSHKLRLDTFGLLTATPAVVAIMYAVDRSTTLGWTSSLVLGLLVVSAGFMAAFIASQLNHRRLAAQLMIPIAAASLVFTVIGGLNDGWTSINTLVMLGSTLLAAISIPIGNRGSTEPLLHLELFNDGTFSWAMVLSFFVVTALFGGMLLVPIYLQQVHGFDALHTGLLLLPMAGTAAITMPLGGLLTDRFGPRPVVLAGLVPLTLGGVVLAQLHPDSSIWLLIIAMALRGFGMGFVMMPSMSAALARIPRQLTSRASSVTNSLQRVSSSVGIAILVTILAAQFATSARGVPCNPTPQVLASASQQLGHPVTAAAFCGQLQTAFSNVKFSGGGSAGSGVQLPGAAGAFAKSYSDSVLSDSFDRTFVFIALITAIGVVPALFLRKPEKQEGRAPALAA